MVKQVQCHELPSIQQAAVGVANENYGQAVLVGDAETVVLSAPHGGYYQTPVPEPMVYGYRFGVPTGGYFQDTTEQMSMENYQQVGPTWSVGLRRTVPTMPWRIVDTVWVSRVGIVDSATHWHPGSMPFSRFNSLLRSTLQHAGLSTARVSPHSFRRGAATYAHSLDVPADVFKAQGN